MRLASTDPVMWRFGIAALAAAPEAPLAGRLAGPVEGPQADTTMSPATRIARLAPGNEASKRDARGLREAVRIAGMLAAGPPHAPRPMVLGVEELQHRRERLE